MLVAINLLPDLVDDVLARGAVNQAILLLVLRYLTLSLRDGHVIARVNDEIILALDFRSLPLNIIHKHLIQVHVQTHELSEALLT